MKVALPCFVATAIHVGLLLVLLLTPDPRLHAHPRAYLREFPLQFSPLTKDVALTMQYFIATHYSSIVDVLANTAGTSLGAVAVRPSRSLGRRLR